VTTTQRPFDGTVLLAPDDPRFFWPHSTFAGFPPCCGPGAEGDITEKAVPETILGLNVSPACWCHDWMQNYGPQTWQGFHHSNAVFLLNILAINRVRGGWWPARQLRLLPILSWYILVSSPVAAANYFRGVRTQGAP